MFFQINKIQSIIKRGVVFIECVRLRDFVLSNLLNLNIYNVSLTHQINHIKSMRRIVLRIKTKLRSHVVCYQILQLKGRQFFWS